MIGDDQRTDGGWRGGPESDMKNGFYASRADVLLREFDRIVDCAQPALVRRYGQQQSGRLVRDARWEFERIIPEIPHIGGLRARPLNVFLRATAMELAVYRAMKRLGRSAAEAWAVCHEAIVARMDTYPAWKIRLMRKLMFSRFMMRRVRKRAARTEPLRLGDFQVRYLMGDGETFDWGVDYLACGNHEFMRTQGAEEFAPYVCMSDIALGEALGWGLTRTQTLADGCEFCDFRFTRGADTHITSKTPAVQATIERIAANEPLETV